MNTLHVSMNFSLSPQRFHFHIQPHCAMSFLMGGLVVPFIRPSAIIQHSHLVHKCFLYGLLMPISTGWHKYVHPLGICSTSTPRACISFTTDAIINGICTNPRTGLALHLQEQCRHKALESAPPIAT